MPDSYPNNASGQLECAEQFINEPALQLKTHPYEACEWNTSLGAKPKLSDSKTDLIYKRAFWNPFVAGACFVGYLFSYMSSN